MASGAVKMATKLGFVAVGAALALAPITQLGASAAETGTPVAAPAGGAAPGLAKGRELFTNWGCNSCHSLADAGASGHVGPAFDGNASLTEPFIISRVTDGQGAMPAFGGQMSDAEIKEIAAYIKATAAK